MGLGYTRQQVEQVRRTGMAPRDMRPGVRNPRNRQTDEDLWRWVAAGGAPPSSPTPTPTTPTPTSTPEEDLRKWIEAGGSTTPDYAGPLYGMPTDGRYAGLGTRSEMDDYVRGRGILLDQEAASRYGEAQDLYDTRRFDVDQSYEDLIAAAQRDVTGLMPTYADVPELADRVYTGGGGPHGSKVQVNRQGLHLPDERVARNETITSAGTQALVGRRPVQVVKPVTDIWSAIDNVEWGMPDPGVAEMEGQPGNGPGHYTYAADGVTPTSWVPDRGVPAPIPLRLAPQTTMQMADSVPYEAPSTRRIGEELWQSNVVPTGQDEQFADYQTDLGGWRDDEMARYQAWLDQAAGFDALQPHEWMQQAGINELGMDPSFVAGAYGPEMSLSLAQSQLGLDRMPVDQFEVDRDNWSLETYGVPYNEYLATEKERAALAEAQMTEDEKAAADQAKADFTMQFSEMTGFDPDALASATDIPEEMLVDLIQSDDYNAALAILQGLDPTTGEPAEYDYDGALELSNALATDDPTLYRLLKVMFPDLFPKASLAAP